MEFLNCISDALNSLFPDSNFVIYTNHRQDEKFPVYVDYTIKLVDTKGGVDLVSTMKVNSLEAAKNKVMRKLTTQFLAQLLHKVSSGEFKPEPKQSM